jgi:outer membrane protein TolC
LINAETAQAVGYSPSPEVWVQATFLHREALQGAAEPLTYDEALETAATANARISVQDSVVDGAWQTVVKARSPLLPQVLSEVSYVTADTPVLELRGLVPDNAAFFGILASQSIYDDRLWTLFRASKYAAEATEYQRESVRLTVLEAAGTTFMGLGLARSLQRIQASNVELTEDFLELAKLRVAVGITGREDVLLWESVLARQKGSLFGAAQRVRTTQTVLNQIMGVAQRRSWTTRDLSGEWETFFTLTERILPVLEDLASVERFREAATEIAIENAPEIAALDEILAAQSLRLRTAKRSFWLPTFSANFAYLTELTGEVRNLPGLDDNFWTFSASVRYPLFRGGARKGEKGKAQAEVNRLERQLRLAREEIELNARIVIETAEGTYPRIAFTRHAAETARENLRIVRDQYGEGAKSITDLLSAQNNLFVAEQLNATAVYEFLGEMVKLQRAIGWFEYDKTPEQREQMFRELAAKSAQSEARR